MTRKLRTQTVPRPEEEWAWTGEAVGKGAPRKERSSFRARRSVLALLAEDSRMPASGPVSSMSLA